MPSLHTERHSMRVNDIDSGDRCSQAGARTGMEAKEEILECDLHSLGRERLAIVPENSSPEVKRHALPVAACLPSLREIG